MDRHFGGQLCVSALLYGKQFNLSFFRELSVCSEHVRDKKKGRECCLFNTRAGSPDLVKTDRQAQGDYSWWGARLMMQPPPLHPSVHHFPSIPGSGFISFLKSFRVLCLAESYHPHLRRCTCGRTHAHTRNDITTGICSARPAIPRMDSGNSEAHKSEITASFWFSQMRSLLLSLMSPAAHSNFYVSKMFPWANIKNC